MTREEAISEWTFRSNHIKKWIDEYGEEPSIRHYVELIDMAIEALTNEQNMHKGKWIKKQVFNPELDEYVPLIECSVCGYEPYYGGSEPKFNYCANCGADMRGSRE